MNDLTDVTVFDELTGNAIVNGVPVKVEAVANNTRKLEMHEDENIEEFIVFGAN